MSSQDARDYLTKEITINRNIVTFRSLSRQLSIHVNAAKNELATYHAENRDNAQHIYATYLVSGELTRTPTATPSQTQDDAMDVDPAADADDGDVVPHTKLVLVGERDLDATTALFGRVHACHVYSLSPSPLRDAGLACAPSDDVRRIDAERDDAFAALVGRVVSPDVKRGPNAGKPRAPRASSSSKNKPAASAPRAPAAQVGKPAAEESAPSKPGKATGKLDWSKAKAKDSSKDAGASKKGQKEIKKEASVNIKQDAPAMEQQSLKRGTKRKSDVVSHPDSEAKTSEPPSPMPSTQRSAASKPPPAKEKGVRVKKGTVVSDDEDDEDENWSAKAKGKGKAKQRDNDSDAERSLRAMMDVDDAEVTRVSRSNHDSQKEEEEETEDGDAPMAMDKADDMAIDEDSDPAPKPKPRKRKEKKVVPVGRNGLKKKRVVKSRMKTDEKGYMVTEDYSSYESVEEDEEDAQEAKASKSQGKGNKKSEGEKGAQKRAASDENGSTKSKGALQERKAEDKKPIKANSSSKPSALKRSSTGSKKDLKDFFGKGGSK